jgi:hypothetical protein
VNAATLPHGLGSVAANLCVVAAQGRAVACAVHVMVYFTRCVPPACEASQGMHTPICPQAAELQAAWRRSRITSYQQLDWHAMSWAHQSATC